MRSRSFLLSAVPLVLVALIIGCDSADDATARLIVRMTDAPIDDLTEVNVTIESCDVFNSDAEEWYTLESTLETPVDLLDYTEGAWVGVCDEVIPFDTFDRFRIVVGDVATIKFGGGDLMDVHIASGSSSGIKFYLDEPVDADGGVLDVLLDFVAHESIVATGPPTDPGYVMTPVIRVVTAELNGKAVTLTDEEPVPSEVQ